MASFEVAFQGQVQPGQDPAQVQARIGQLFQVGEQQLSRLFSGRRILIKQGLDAATAEKYRQAIERAGALCEVQPMAAQPAATPAPAAPAPTTAAARPAPAAPAPRDEFMAAFADVQAPDLPLAETGANLQDSYPDYTPLDIDLSAFSLAPVGSDLEQLPPDPAPAVPDTSHLRLAD